MQRALQRVDDGWRLAGLVVEQIDRMTRVVPQQVIGPAARLALEVDVLAPEEERLHDEMLELELAFLDAIRDPLMRGIEPARMARHRDLLGRFLRLVNLARV